MSGVRSAGVVVVGLMVLVQLQACCCGDVDMEGVGDVFNAVQGGMQMIKEAQNAPGMAELRGEGCDTAMVMTPEMIKRFTEAVKDLDEKHGDGTADFDVPEGLDRAMVTCTMPQGAKALKCDALAKTYIEATKPATDFVMTVTVPGDQKPACQSNYNPKGEASAWTPPSEGSGAVKVRKTKVKTIEIGKGDAKDKEIKKVPVKKP